jgi:hypothetical protein
MCIWQAVFAEFQVFLIPMFSCQDSIFLFRKRHRAWKNWAGDFWLSRAVHIDFRLQPLGQNVLRLDRRIWYGCGRHSIRRRSPLYMIYDDICRIVFIFRIVSILGVVMSRPVVIQMYEASDTTVEKAFDVQLVQFVFACRMRTLPWLQLSAATYLLVVSAS